MRIFCLTHGPTRSWRNGDAQWCQLSNIADPFSDFFPFKKAPKSYLVSENRWYCRTSARSCFPSARAHTHTHTHISLSLSLCVCSVSVQRAAEKCSALIQLNLVWAIYLNSSVKPVPWLALNLCQTQLNTDIMLLASLHTSIAKITALLLSLSYVYLIS